ncbi:MAG: N-acetyl-gamma-glutamyl-phosphate reductase [Oceanospirillaceae bacterium]|jgi:N-acetyl-gamma-glutamyl-phosphate reductase|nr:N-acetyl-gamma-glutamyl-phosphate reductase [Oceanospirillaceae bacterium]MBT4441701.1 N-acetyl-gamma-glutamyl-phosphate reductase [Oceanospirillaceae bacterium]MBT6077606.1 N-acetyl-gamma-glutamyl-phosphate reductase [Oceanospirillaceae bacterium]
MNLPKQKVAIVGGTGYTGVELLRLLARHPQIEVCAITSRSEAGKAVSDIYPSLRGEYDLAFTEPTTDTLAQADLVFFATPNGVAMKQVPELLAAGIKVIDLAADFRIQDIDVWSRWYGMDHACAELVAQAVYGLPEVNKEAIKQASLVANPGCYPTAVQLGLLPLIEQGLIATDHIVADCKSGVSGAGRGAAVGSLMCEAGDSFKAYGVAGHRHLPEIKERLSVANDAPVGVTFVPHLTPMIRGIHATLYARLTNTQESLETIQVWFESRYIDHPFVDVMPLGSHPETRSVRGSNICRIALHKPQGEDTLVILSAIDNLVKGAAGQAIHNMNLMLGLEETAGLSIVPLAP